MFCFVYVLEQEAKFSSCCDPSYCDDVCDTMRCHNLFMYVLKTIAISIISISRLEVNVCCFIIMADNVCSTCVSLKYYKFYIVHFTSRNHNKRRSKRAEEESNASF